jgi:hypothetical protein
MTVVEIARWITEWPLAVAIREGDWSFPLIESLHVLSFTAVVGSISAVDLRLLGVRSRKLSIRRYCAEILPITWVAFACAAISGSLLFISRAPAYVANISFLLKLSLLAAAGINMLVFHVFTWKKEDRWDVDVLPSTAARMAGGLSLVLWLCVIFFGRRVGFTLSRG